MSIEKVPSKPGRATAIARKIRVRIARLTIPVGPWLAKRVKPPPRPLVTLGTTYGGWTMVEPAETGSDRYGILCGAGEDISFDLSLQAKYGFRCVIIDPTPRAIEHWRQLGDSAAAGREMPINNSLTESYDLSAVDLTKISYVASAVWIRNEELKFWSPSDPSHVSFSAANIQASNTFIKVPAATLTSLCGTHPDTVEVLKLDVEGVGAQLIEWMVENNYRPSQILVEFEECIFPTNDNFSTLKRAVQKLEDSGYDLVYFDGQANCTFAKREETPANRNSHAL